MPNNSHPYRFLPFAAFWKTAVAELDTLDIDLLATGCKVLVITDPPQESENDAPACEIIDTFLADFYQSIGCLTFNAGQWIKQQGGMPDEFRTIDSIHCAQDYYHQLTSELFSRFSIKQE
ncbi:hypothetical protein [Undibacterium sp.]|uniref:hypothetical protein n=1 Tax=Undibacterium sp. TaxID=1914977 RepID=UPI0025FF2378|nr:hypothetical protein [Undibacterium sp.]